MSAEMVGPAPDSPDDAPKPPRRRIFRKILAAAAALLVVIQFVPYGRQHTNPTATAGITWDSQATEDLVRRACFDCHSHETHWPWYSHVAPASWLVQRDVDEGRGELNFSIGQLRHIDEAAGVIQSGEMPPWFYVPLHAQARLSSAEKDQLMKGLEATFGDAAKAGHATGGDDDD